MAKELMSDAEIKRRKRVQGHISQTTGAIGLGALAGTLVASRGGRNTLRKIPKVERFIKKPPPKDPNRDRIKGAITPALTTSAGLGGLGAFNFAAYTNAESRKRKAAAPVKKRDEMAPEYGEVAKAWTPQTTPYDPEKKRLNRNEKQQVAAFAGGGTLGGAAAAQTAIAGNLKRKANEGKKATAEYRSTKKKIKAIDKAPITARPTSDAKYRALHAKKSRLAPEVARAAKHGRLATKNIRSAAALGAAGAAAVGAGEFIRHRKKSESWQPYAKRDAVSAFGVDHTEWTRTRD